MNTLDFRKRAIMSTLGNVEKTVKVEGDKTIKFSNDTDYKITNFKLYGWTNEIGEGEKSPDNPYTFEHYENPSVTVRGKNILDTKSLKYSSDNNNTKTTVLENGYIKIKPTSENPTFLHICNFNFSFEPGTYTIFADIISTNYTHTDNYIIYSTTTGWISKKVPTNLTVTENKTINFGIYMDRLQNGQLTTEDEMVVSVMILKGSLTSSEIGEYEPYKEPKTIQLSDVVLRGIKCGHDEQNSSIKAKDIALKKEAIEKDLWQGYMTSDEVFYWADNIEYNNGMLLKSNNTRVYKPTGITYIGDPNYKYTIEDITIYVYMLLIEQGTATYQGATTEIAKEDGISSSVAILGCRATHFENSLENYYTRKVSPYPYMFGLGGVSGSYVSFLSFRLPETVGNTQENANAYLKALFKETSDLYLLVPRKMADDNLSDTNATALKQLLSQSFSGTTIIETNGYIKAEFKYKE